MRTDPPSIQRQTEVLLELNSGTKCRLPPLEAEGSKTRKKGAFWKRVLGGCAQEPRLRLSPQKVSRATTFHGKSYPALTVRGDPADEASQDGGPTPIVACMGPPVLAKNHSFDASACKGFVFVLACLGYRHQKLTKELPCALCSTMEATARWLLRAGKEDEWSQHADQSCEGRDRHMGHT